MKNIDSNIWCMDVETFKECFTYVAINKDTEEIVKYVIHKDLNQIDDLLIHLKSIKGHIGFNNLAFDYPVIHELLIWNTEYELSAENIIDVTYKKAQRLIEEQSFGLENKFNGIKEKNMLIPQLDLFKLWHFNNSARSTSLKSLEISMNYPNVMESSIHHTKENLSLLEVYEVLA